MRLYQQFARFVRIMQDLCNILLLSFVLLIILFLLTPFHTAPFAGSQILEDISLQLYLVTLEASYQEGLVLFLQSR